MSNIEIKKTFRKKNVFYIQAFSLKSTEGNLIIFRSVARSSIDHFVCRLSSVSSG